MNCWAKVSGPYGTENTRRAVASLNEMWANDKGLRARSRRVGTAGPSGLPGGDLISVTMLQSRVFKELSLWPLCLRGEHFSCSNEEGGTALPPRRSCQSAWRFAAGGKPLPFTVGDQCPPLLVGQSAGPA